MSQIPRYLLAVAACLCGIAATGRDAHAQCSHGGGMGSPGGSGSLAMGGVSNVAYSTPALTMSAYGNNPLVMSQYLATQNQMLQMQRQMHAAQQQMMLQRAQQQYEAQRDLLALRRDRAASNREARAQRLALRKEQREAERSGSRSTTSLVAVTQHGERAADEVSNPFASLSR